MAAPLLLYSLTEFRDLLFECADLADVKTVIEVGSEAGAFTHELAAWAGRKGGKVTCIEPNPTPAVRETVGRSPHLELVEGFSPAALAHVAPADLYLLDGDHNYATVRGELETVDRQVRAAGRHALLVLHDVGWPCARRDQYYAPQALPADAVHPHTFEEGVTLDNAGVIQGGFRGMGAFAVARHEGGPRNGVMTAVEDFLKGREDLVLAEVPCIFGVGIIYSREAPYAEALSAYLRAYDKNPLLAKLEANRLTLYLRVIEMQDQWAERERALVPEREQLTQRLAALEQELAHERRERLAAEESLRQWRQMTNRVRTARDRIAPEGTDRRRVCDAAVRALKTVWPPGA